MSAAGVGICSNSVVPWPGPDSTVSHRDDNVEELHERFSEALSRFFDLPVMILFGAALPWAAQARLGWRGVLFAAAVLVLRRPTAWLLLSQFMS